MGAKKPVQHQDQAGPKPALSLEELNDRLDFFNERYNNLIDIHQGTSKALLDRDNTAIELTKALVAEKLKGKELTVAVELFMLTTKALATLALNLPKPKESEERTVEDA